MTKVVWVTGAHGFLGRHLSAHMAGLGSVVYGVGHGHWPPANALASGVSYWINGEVGPASLDLLLRQSGPPGIVFHLAGGSAVGASLANPYEDFERTVSTTARVLDWVRLRVPEAVVVAASSAAVYGAGHDGAIDEGASCAPYSPYGYHKAAMEMLCRSYAQNFGLRIRIARVFSAYGENLRKQLLWDLCCKLSVDDRTLVLDGTGDERRDWLHAQDIAGAMACIARSADGDVARFVNVGSGSGTPVSAVAQMVARAWGTQTTPTFTGRSRPGDPVSLVAAVSRLTALGFSPGIPLHDGIVRYVAWYRRQGGR
jgi:UDP-glucose 4-epimerase